MTSHHQRPVLPPRGTARPSRVSSLPDDLLARAVSRLRLSAAVVGAAGLVRIILPALVDAATSFGAGAEEAAKVAIFAAVVALSGALFGLTYLKARPTRHLLFGQIYFVLVVTLVGAADAASPWGDTPLARGIPMASAFLLVFPVIVPMPPRRFVRVTAIAIALQPLVVLAMPALVGFATPSATIIALGVVPLVASAIVAYVVASVIYGLGRDLSRAQKLGSYQLVAPLGKGGMGEVWRAKHGMLARQAAIKLIRQDRAAADHADLVSRFEHEARVVASLRSPHTIQLWDFGTTDDGALYYAMELLDGMDLDRLVTTHGPVPPERVVHILTQACHSLAEAHEAGLVHRDIKPANLFLTRLGRDVDVVKVLDFGLATQPVRERPADAGVTQRGEILGTPAYMAPEQVLGDQTIDGRADLYALGLVAFWLLTGRDVFQATSASQVMFAHLHVEAEPPSAYARVPLPPELDALVLRCLAKAREDRPQTAEALAAELARVPLEAPWTRAHALAWWAALPAQAHAAEAAATADTFVAPSVVRRPDALDSA